MPKCNAMQCSIQGAETLSLPDQEIVVLMGYFLLLSVKDDRLSWKEVGSLKIETRNNWTDFCL